MEDLEFQFRAKIEVAKECIEICHGDPEATMAETTSALIEIGELKRKMQILRTVVDKLKLQTVRAEKITGYMQNRIEMCDHISENLPKRIVANTEVKEKKKNETEAKTGQNQQYNYFHALFQCKLTRLMFVSKQSMKILSGFLLLLFRRFAISPWMISIRFQST